MNAEERIALVMLDTVDFPVAFWGALRAGIVPVPINTLLPADATGYILEDSRAAALVVSAPLLAPLRPALDRLGLGRIIVSAPDGNGGDFDAFLGSAASNVRQPPTTAPIVAISPSRNSLSPPVGSPRPG